MTMENLVIPAFVKADIPQEVKNLTMCSKFVYAAECQDCKTEHFKGFNKCTSRWCINCNHKRSLAWTARLLPTLEKFIENGYTVTLLNFTIKHENIGNLKETIKKLEVCWRELVHDDKERRKLWKKRFPGCIRSLEVKIGKYSGIWNAHFHLITLQKVDEHQKDYGWIKEAWKDITKRRLGHEGSAWLHGVKKDGLLKATIETLKYIMKPESKIYTEIDYLIEAYCALKGKRQVNTWGLLRGLAQKAEEDFKNEDEKKLADFICQRCGCTYAELITMIYTEIPEKLILYDYKPKEV